ncbi:hypothetical protein M0Q97_08985 [Candidatus Dojkabacteria bacterium]|jgi:hypothetical protein|nr:hypothetical protein [Candidatus Dojkabacteria bacterium]
MNIIEKIVSEIYLKMPDTISWYEKDYLIDLTEIVDEIVYSNRFSLNEQNLYRLNKNSYILLVFKEIDLIK